MCVFSDHKSRRRASANNTQPGVLLNSQNLSSHHIRPTNKGTKTERIKHLASGWPGIHLFNHQHRTRRVCLARGIFHCDCRAALNKYYRPQPFNGGGKYGLTAGQRVTSLPQKYGYYLHCVACIGYLCFVDSLAGPTETHEIALSQPHKPIFSRNLPDAKSVWNTLCTRPITRQGQYLHATELPTRSGVIYL